MSAAPPPGEATTLDAPRPPGTFRLARISGIDVLVTPSWFIIAALISVMSAPIVERVEPGLGFGAYVVGFGFAVLLYLSVFLHEVAHALMARRYGYPVVSITLAFLGGTTVIGGEARTPRQEFMIAVVGPLVSIAVGVAAYLALDLGSSGLWTLSMWGLVYANLFVGALNLVPGLPLDGGRVLKALVWGITGNLHQGTLIAGWCGRLLAVLVLAWPLFGPRLMGAHPRLIDYLIAAVLAVFLWTGASAAMSSARLRRRLPHLVARQLARRALPVASGTPVADALRLLHDRAAEAVVPISESGHPIGLAWRTELESAQGAAQPGLTVSGLAHTIPDGPALPADIRGEDLVRALGHSPAPHYLLVEPDGGLAGVLVTADVDEAFRAQR